jgi:hypothetical protein
MGRAIEQENSFLQVLLKLIPSEVIAVFIFIQGVMPRSLAPHLVVALLLVAITPVYLYWAGGVRSRPQLWISTLSLVVWIYAMGAGPLRFVRPPYYEPWHGAVLLAVWTLVPPMFLARAAGAERRSAGAAPTRAEPRSHSRNARTRRSPASEKVARGQARFRR